MGINISVVLVLNRVRFPGLWTETPCSCHLFAGLAPKPLANLVLAHGLCLSEPEGPVNVFHSLNVSSIPPASKQRQCLAFKSVDSPSQPMLRGIIQANWWCLPFVLMRCQ